MPVLPLSATAICLRRTARIGQNCSSQVSQQFNALFWRKLNFEKFGIHGPICGKQCVTGGNVPGGTNKGLVSRRLAFDLLCRPSSPRFRPKCPKRAILSNRDGGDTIVAYLVRTARVVSRLFVRVKLFFRAQ